MFFICLLNDIANIINHFQISKRFLLIYLSKARFWLMDNNNLRAFCEDV